MGELARILVDKNNNLYSVHQLNTGEISTCSVKDTNLVYDCMTQIVYYKFEANRATLCRVGFMAPYISENGKYCRFIDNKIVEVG